MAKNKIITSQGNVQFINSKGRTIDMHPMHCYAIYENDTVSFLFIYMKEYSGQAFFASQYEDLELNGETYDSLDELKDAINYEFAKAGAQARTEIVTELPEDPFTNTIYLLPKEHGQGYDEYIWNEDEGWQLIGDTDIEFERYLKIEDFNPYSADTKDYIDAVSGNTVQNASDIVSLSGAIDTEISARTDADTALSGAIDSVASDLADEVSARTQADTTLQNNITSVNNRVDAEQIARANADTAISGAVDSVSGAVSTLSGEVQTMGDEAIVDAEYVSSSTTIDFYNASGDVVSQIDATPFITDGMIDDVRIETISGVTYLVIDFNTASGKEDIKIPLTDIFNPDNYYDKTSVDGKLALKADLSALTEDERVWGEALNDLNSRINTVSGDVADKVDTSVYNTYTANTQTAISAKANSADVYNKSQVYTKAEVDQAISGKVATTDFETYSGATDSRLTEDEEVISAALNVLNESINAVSGAIPTTTSVVASGSTAVVESRGVYSQMDGLKLRKLTQIAYDRLQIKDNNTLYIIVD